MGRLFGTDGVRGVANTELSADLAFKLGQAGALVLAAETKHKPIILIGKDTRISCDMLEGAMIAGICSVGADVVSLGVIPTPAVAYLTRLYKADAGVVISASHNTFEFNGVKFFNGDGFKLADDVEDKIEHCIKNELDGLELPVGDKVGRHSVCGSALADYVGYLKPICSEGLSGLKVALDCANGAAYEAAPALFRELGADVAVVGEAPDGMNINASCGSTHIDGLLKLTVESGADVGFAFDGDADRVLASDENGRLVDGDALMALIASDLAGKGRLRGGAVVATVMSNLGLELAMSKIGVKLIRAPVGDRYVLEEMQKASCVFGGEQSGHIIYTELGTTGDGVASALMAINILAAQKKKFSEIANIMTAMPQVQRNARVANEKKYRFLEDDVVKGKCGEIESKFGGEGRVVIRPSGTEPLVRVMIEAKDIDVITKYAEELVKVIEERLG